MLREEVIREWEKLKSNIPRHYQSHLRTIYESMSNISAGRGVTIPIPVKFNLETIAQDTQKFAEERWKEKKELIHLSSFKKMVIEKLSEYVKPEEIHKLNIIS